MPARFGIDTGGTFTDLVRFDESGLRVHKVRSTPGDPSAAVLAGLAALEPSPLDARSPVDREVVHGSTVATNALLERKGARVVLVTTEGFEDLLTIGRQTRRELYNPFVEAPRPIVSSGDTTGLPERVLADGSILRPLAEEALDRLLAWLRQREVDAVAVCLLHAWANPVHERQVSARLSSAGYRVSASHEVVAEYREFERGSTTAVNAYVTPLMASYLSRLAERIGGDSLRIMQSNGGTMSVPEASRAAVQTVLSGPAGGVVGASAIAAAAGFRRAITFDMGGTSTDVSLVDGAPSWTAEASLGDFPIRVPVLDIHTVGAGGGSIARLDAGGALRVGPESAGADPGPACYGQGDRPTVTDANLVLGRIDPDRFLGGRMRVDAGRSSAVLHDLAARAGLDVFGLAEGIVRVANANMERAIRVVSVERGFDPRDFALVAFGGAGGLHACDLAASLDMRTILVPAHPGVLSAIGMLLSDSVSDFSQTVLGDAATVDRAAVAGALEGLCRKARARLRDAGLDDPAMRIERSVDLRYVGQSYEITVALPGDDEEVLPVDALAGAFHAAHLRQYGYSNPSRPVELVNVRVRGVGVTRKPVLAGGVACDRAAIEPAAYRPVFVDGRMRETPVIDRASLEPGHMFAGPALVVDEGSTTLVGGSWEARVDAGQNLVVVRCEEAA